MKIFRGIYRLSKTFADTGVRLSVLDLVPIVQGNTAADALRNSLDLAQHVENWGYHRYWLAEHHNMPGIASSATSVVIAHIAAGTQKIRVGSGGIMLPNHSPLMIAEQFGTLESLFPGRIDLGLGRAPGSDHATMRAIRRGLQQDGDDFPELLNELQQYFESHGEERRVRAIPGEGLSIPIWLLGSSDFSARLAARLGLPFAFASHFSPGYLLYAIQQYRQLFQSSSAEAKPYVMVGANVIVAESDEEAKFLATSMQQQVLSLIRGKPGQLPPPVENIDELWNPMEKAALEERARYTFIGTLSTVEAKILDFIRETSADEIIISSSIYSHSARVESYRRLGKLLQ
ncbi:LLM class flavin-dependent oxidoreductase [Alicyclobacillus sp. TC]|nr:LLM class flavin-dependent oxidoreductase [Alicyclobacillus sp. TC]